MQDRPEAPAYSVFNTSVNALSSGCGSTLNPSLCISFSMPLLPASTSPRISFNPCSRAASNKACSSKVPMPRPCQSSATSNANSQASLSGSVMKRATASISSPPSPSRVIASAISRS